MSIITSNASCNPSSISVTGKTNGSGTISWSLPTVPASGTINSCKLTGTCTISDSSGKPATVKVNGTSVSSGVAFTINLGTGNTTTSVAVAATGPHKNTKSTITFSNLVYTVTYEEAVQVKTYTVTFKDWNGTTLKTQTVAEGSSATAPSNPTRTGYRFTGWDKTFNNVTSDLTVTAQYTLENGEPEESYLVAKYTANAAGIVPTFNDGYTYEVSETESNGIYTVQITSDTDFSSISFKSKYRLLTVEYLKITNAVTSTYQLFYGCTALTSINGMADWDTINVTDMNHMFYNCNKLTTIDVSNFNTSKVTNMRYMFNNCSSLTELDVSNFNTSKVTNMNSMFSGCQSLTSLNVSSFNTTEVTNMNHMFYNCYLLTELDVSNFNTSNVTGMYSMFYNCDNLTTLDLSNFDTSKVTDMQSMFQSCTFLTTLDISNFNTNKVTNMGSILRNCTNLASISMKNSDYNSVNKIIAELPTRTTDSMGTLNIESVDDFNQIDIATTQSKFWNVVNGEPEEDIIEWTGIGTIATRLKAHAGDDGYSHDSYKINLDWENESFDIIIVDELGRSSSYSYNIGSIGDIKIGDTKLSIIFSDGAISIYSNNTDNVLEYYNSDYGNFPFVVSFTKKGIYVKSSVNTGEYSTPEFLSGSENIYEINQPIYLIDDGLIHSSVSNQENPKYDILFDLAVSEYSEQTEEPDNNDLIQGDINDESGTFEDEVSNVVKTKYIYVSDKKQILVNVLTEDVYILKCYLYNANKELVKIIDISADKKRMFGLDLQKLIEEVMNDGNE